MGSTPVGDICQESLRFLPCLSSDSLLRDLRLPSSVKKKEKEFPGTLWELKQRGVSQTPSLALAAGEPGFSGGKGHGRP